MSQLAGHFLGQALAKYFIVLSNNPSSTLSSAIQKLCVKLADGHTCIDLEEIDDNQQPCSLEELRSALFYSGVVSAPGKIAPFILDEKNRFYFYRYYFYEQRLSELLVKRILQKPQVDKTRIRQLLDELFVSGQPWPNLQKVAAALAVTNQFCIVTGGPGTGKTSTLTRIILLLLRFSDIPLNIKLAAPTGKAAQRMQESIRAQIISLHDPERLPFGFPEKASTIHSLLGARSDGVSFYHDANRPLECDVLIIDEASMIDVALMYRIMEALPLSSKLIIVGDPYQLASVEAGSVLTQLVDEGGFDFERVSDIEAMTGERVNPGTKPNFLSQCHIALTQSYRFNEKSGIGKLCLSVNEGEFGKVKALLDDPVYSDISSLEWTGWSGLESFIFNGYKNYVETVMHGPSNLSENIFKIFSEFRLICAIRDGNQGVIGANTAIENILMH
ncbi:MAG: AAA family ATPase, partial [Pseudomonadota bacterium]|nr:AAA family ATPase [Pseudomonadota bacterium]